MIKLGDKVKRNINVGQHTIYKQIYYEGVVVDIDPKGRWYMVEFNLGEWYDRGGDRVVRECYTVY